MNRIQSTTDTTMTTNARTLPPGPIRSSAATFFALLGATSFASAGQPVAKPASGVHAPVRIAVEQMPKLEGPEFADIDGDGKNDLLSANYAGQLFFRKNIGSNTKPQFEAPKKLKTGTDVIKIKHW